MTGSSNDTIAPHLARYRDLRASLQEQILPLATSLDGRTFRLQAPVALAIQPGGYVRLDTDAGPVLGQVLEHELVRRPGPEIEAPTGDGTTFRSTVEFDAAIGRGRLLDETTPFHDAVIVPASGDDVARWFGRPSGGRAKLAIGKALLAPEVPIELDAGAFDRHTFLCGQSGAGKSYALGVLLEQLLLQTRLRIIVLDPNGDFVRLATVRRDADPADAKRWANTVAPGVAVRTFGAEGDARLRLRFFDLPPELQAATTGLDPLADREEYSAFLSVLEQERQSHSVEGLRVVLAAEAAEDPGMARLAQRLRNLQLEDWSLWSGVADDPGLLGELGADGPRLLVADLGSAPSPAERSLVAASVLERLWARRGEREPVLIVMDEAHNICPGEPGDALTAIASQYAVRIAAEGRKFGLYLLVATQRPQKVHPNVLSQCDNLAMMRLNSAPDIEHLAGAMSFAPPSLIARASVLRQGEALLAGKLSPQPAFVRFGRRIAEEGGSDVPSTWADELR